MARSAKTWKILIDGKTSNQIAKLLLSDLLGYRKTSLKRAEDEDNITYLIAALKSEGKSNE